MPKKPIACKVCTQEYTLNGSVDAIKEMLEHDGSYVCSKTNCQKTVNPKHVHNGEE